MLVVLSMTGRQPAFKFAQRRSTKTRGTPQLTLPIKTQGRDKNKLVPGSSLFLPTSRERKEPGSDDVKIV